MRTSPAHFFALRAAMGRVFLLVACLSGSMLPLGATDPIWTNTGRITFAPQIDATAFVNYGIIAVETTIPFETSNTRYYTNFGTMQGFPGYWFQTSPSITGVRTPAASFVNQGGAVIQAGEPGVTLVFTNINGTNVLTSVGGNSPSWVWVTATNILNRGHLSVGANGWMKLAGQTVDVARSGLEVTSIVPRGSIQFSNQFFPEAGIFDLYADTTNDPAVVTDGIWVNSGFFGPLATVPPGTTYGGQYRFTLQDPYADSYGSTNGFIQITVTNLVGVTNLDSATITNLQETNIVVETISVPTNITRQAAFVTVSDPSVMGVEIGWIPNQNPTNFYATPSVYIATYLDNVVTANQELNELYFYDFLGSRADERGLAQNMDVSTFRPINFRLSRMNDYGFGSPGQGVPPFNYLYDPDFTNVLAAATWAAYGAYVANIPNVPPLHPSGTYTNLPGRIQIEADTLDMSRTRVRGQGQIVVNAKHVLSTSNAVVDGPHLAFNLASTNENLTFANLAKATVNRLQGDLYAYSAVWQNQWILYATNWNIVTNLDTNGAIQGLDATLAVVTNVADVNLHVLLISGDSLLTQLPVFVWDLSLRSRNVVVNDNMSVVQSFFTDAESLSINGGISFREGYWQTPFQTAVFVPMNDFGGTNIPNLLNFTNRGTFSVPHLANFGSDRVTPLSTFVNAGGTFSAFTLNVNSDLFRNSGQLSITGPLTVHAGDVSLENGSSVSTLTSLTADNLRMTGYTLNARRTLRLDVPGVFTDAGTAGTANSIILSNGINVVSRPAQGDLLATTIDSRLQPFVETYHVWAAADLGATNLGYANNLAVGRWVLTGDPRRTPLAVFEGALSGSALYVDLLDLTTLGSGYEELMEIAPGFTIYFAAAALGFTPPDLGNGITQTPEEYLDGKFDGRLRWVSSFAGPNSSSPVLVDGVTVAMNTGLRNSKLIDSDGDGIPNFYDTTPLGGTTESPLPGGGLVVTPQFVAPTGGGAQSVSISWTAAPNTAYEVEVSDNLLNPEWMPLKSVVNGSSAPQAMTISDPIAGSGQQRYYRIRVKP